MNNEFSAGAVIMLICCLICTATMFGLAQWSLRRKTPMHFWAGDTVKPEAIRNIPAYNRANAKMWMGYGSIFLIGSIISILSIITRTPALLTAAGIWIGVTGIVTIIPLILIYNKIYNKYKV